MFKGNRVKELREKIGLTQEELAHKLGYRSKSSVAHIENGRDIPRTMVAELSRILGTTPAYLMGWDDEISSYQMSDSSAGIKKQPRGKLPQSQREKVITMISESLSQMTDKDIDDLNTFCEFLGFRRQQLPEE